MWGIIGLYQSPFWCDNLNIYLSSLFQTFGRLAKEKSRCSDSLWLIAIVKAFYEKRCDIPRKKGTFSFSDVHF